MSESHEKILDIRSVFDFEARIITSAAATGSEEIEMDCSLEPG